MRKILMRSATAILVSIAAFISPIYAEDQISLDDFEYVGDVGDFTVYSVKDVDGLWLISSDGTTIINGNVYSLSDNKVEINFEPGEMSDLPQFVSHSEPALVHDVDVLDENIDYGGLDMDVVNKSMKGLTEEEKNKLVADLVARMNSANSPEEFQLLVREWQANLQGDEQAAFLARKGLAILRGDDVPPEHAVLKMPARDEDDNVSSASATKINAQTAADDNKASNNAYLFNQMRNEGFWIPIGKSDAPVVYMFLDPSCPYCAKSFHNLAPDIANGELQIRALLVPAISKSSAGKIAAILKSENPVTAIMQHELQYAERGASDLHPVDFSSLSQETNDKIRKNYNILIYNGLPGVPFFAYATEEGIKFLSGVAHSGQFASALPAGDS